MHLAWAEMYICLASLFRRCRIELFETGERDVRMHNKSKKYDLVSKEQNSKTRGPRCGPVENPPRTGDF